MGGDGGMTGAGTGAGAGAGIDALVVADGAGGGAVKVGFHSLAPTLNLNSFAFGFIFAE